MRIPFRVILHQTPLHKNQDLMNLRGWRMRRVLCDVCDSSRTGSLPVNVSAEASRLAQMLTPIVSAFSRGEYLLSALICGLACRQGMVSKLDKSPGRNLHGEIADPEKQGLRQSSISILTHYHLLRDLDQASI